MAGKSKNKLLRAKQDGQEEEDGFIVNKPGEEFFGKSEQIKGLTNVSSNPFKTTSTFD